MQQNWVFLKKRGALKCVVEEKVDGVQGDRWISAYYKSHALNYAIFFERGSDPESILGGASWKKSNFLPKKIRSHGSQYFSRIIKSFNRS